MKKLLTIILLVIQSLLCKGQLEMPLPIGMQPFFILDNYTDTISYDILIKADRHLYAKPIYKGLNPGYYGFITYESVLSYEISINNGKPKIIKGRSKKMKAKELKQGGTITITNFKVKYNIQDEKPKEYSYPNQKFVFHILPAK